MTIISRFVLILVGDRIPFCLVRKFEHYPEVGTFHLPEELLTWPHWSLMDDRGLARL